MLLGSFFMLVNIECCRYRQVYFEAYRCVLDTITSLAFMDLTLSVV